MKDPELALVVTILGQALMRRAFTDLAAEFGTVDADAAERAVHMCEAFLSEQLAEMRDQPVRGVVLSEDTLATISSNLCEMTDAALEQIRRERTGRH